MARQPYEAWARYLSTKLEALGWVAGGTFAVAYGDGKTNLVQPQHVEAHRLQRWGGGVKCGWKTRRVARGGGSEDDGAKHRDNYRDCPISLHFTS